ncbi:MAG: flavodoxin family protein [Spirochaetes bacterium]|nr:flavodoxin family protein [Spirochaetota bacterium]
MKIVILNGNPSTANKDLDHYLESLSRELAASGHSIQTVILRDKDIRYCTGCWTCWWKTPGVCVHKDDMPAIYSAIMASDLVLLATPVIMGFVSALLKRANERFIPLLHPYFAMREGEWHHRGRYTRYPAFGIIMAKGADTDDEDIAIITDIYRRQAVNFLTSLKLAFTTDLAVKETCDAISAL